MKFITVRDLRTKTAQIRKDLEKDHEMVVTANGRPFAVLSSVVPENLEDIIDGARRARFKAAVKRMQEHAKEQGLDNMTMEEIDAIIAKVRQEKRERESADVQ